MKKVILIALIILCFSFGLLLLHSSINGYIADPAFFYSYTTPSPDNKYVFVMLGPKPDDPSDSQWRDERMEESRRLHAKFPSSGLYLNDGSTTPLWVVSEYSWEVFIPSDGIHLVMPASWPSTSSDEALTFYESGKVLRRYRVNDLVDLTWFLPGGHQHFVWEKSIALDDQKRTMSVTTQHYDHYDFDVTTGEIISSRHPSRMLIVGLALCVLYVIVRSVGKRFKSTRI
jgi:hypothetical protein